MCSRSTRCGPARSPWVSPPTSMHSDTWKRCCACRLLSHRSMNGQLECHGSQEERKCQDRHPDPNNMEALRVVDLRLPILGWRARLPGERGTVDRDGANDPDHDPGEYGNHSRAPEPKAGRG